MRVPTAAFRLASPGGRLVSNSPFGNFGPLLASLTAASVVISALAVHLYNSIARQLTSGDPFLDNAALLAMGVVLGVGAIGGTAAKADLEAQSAHARLDAAGVPPAPGGGNGGSAPHG